MCVVCIQGGLGALAPQKRRRSQRARSTSMGLKTLTLPTTPDISSSQHKRIQDWVPPPEVLAYMQVRACALLAGCRYGITLNNVSRAGKT